MRRRCGGDHVGQGDGDVRGQFEDLRRLARAGLALELQTLGQGGALSGRDQRRQRPGRPDRRSRPIAQKLDQVVHALGQVGGAQIGLVGDPLVVEG